MSTICYEYVIRCVNHNYHLWKLIKLNKLFENMTLAAKRALWAAVDTFETLDEGDCGLCGSG